MKSLFYAARPILTDMLSTILFAALFGLTNNIYVSTGAAMALGMAQVGFEKLRRKPVPGLQWASLCLVTVLGGITLITGDPRFVMIKPTIIYLTIGTAMLQRGWMDRYIPPEGKEHVSAGLITVWGYVWSGLMFATAGANLIIAVWFGHKAWLAFVGIFPLASKLGLFAIQYSSMRYIGMRNYRAREAALSEAQPA